MRKIQRAVLSVFDKRGLLSFAQVLAEAGVELISTGGTANKLPGRVGDSPLIGCGLYADDQSGGCSSTGWGESIIKVLLAKTARSMRRWNGTSDDARLVKLPR